MTSLVTDKHKYKHKKWSNVSTRNYNRYEKSEYNDSLTKKTYQCKDYLSSKTCDFLSKKFGFRFIPFTESDKAKVRRCQWNSKNKGPCKGAHGSEEMIIQKHIKSFSEFDLSNFDILTGFQNMKNCIEMSEKKVSIEDKLNIQNIMKNPDDFIGILKLWKDLREIYGTIKSCLNQDEEYKDKKWKDKRKPSNLETYKFRKDIPTFTFPNEDIYWEIFRRLNMCPRRTIVTGKICKIVEDYQVALKTRQDFYKMKGQKNKINSLERGKILDQVKKNQSSIISVHHICLGDKNCKFGVHSKSLQICIDDFINGECNCIYKTNDSIDIKLAKLKEQKKIIDKKENKSEYSNICRQISNLSNKECKMHYTEVGMIPVSKQIKNMKDKKKAHEEEEKEKLFPSKNVAKKPMRKFNLKLK